MSPEGECSQAEESSTMAGVVLDQAHYPLNASPSTGAEPTAQHPSSMSIPSVDTTTDVLEMINRGANTQPKSHSSSSIPSIEIDVERFEGKIVYNPDGSAYIIEGESELSEDDSLPEGCIVDGRGISVPHTQEFPQIASAYYVSRSYNPQGYQYQSDRKPIISSSSEFPIMHSYRVFTYRYNGGKSPLQQPDSESMISATSVPIKPILMCFICKLSFGHVKSFTSHAGHEHELSLLESEKRVLSHSTTSAIIQVVGRNKQPIISILEPILQPPSHENVSEQIRSLCSRNGESDCDKKSLNEKEIDGHLKNISHNTNKSAPGSNETILAQKSIITDSVECQLEQQQFRWINVPISYNSASSSTFSKSLSNSSMHTLHQPPNFVSGTTIGVCPEHLQGRPSGIECTKCEGILMNTRLSTTGGPSTGIHSRNSCKTLKCPKCNWHYKYQETLEIHMKEKHPDAEISCIYCISGQPHPRLARGETYTCGYKPYRCEVCNYSTTTKGNLSIHMQSDKHLNNMQELQQGGGGLNSNDAQSRQDSSMHNQNSHSCHSPSVIGQSMGHGKSKPVFRCDACNYETNVARNLRIHMTSEKHTHHMMVLQSSIKHMRTLSALQSHQQQTHQNRIQRQQQIEQLLQLGDLDKTQQAEAALADMAYSQALMIQMMTGGRFPLNVTPDSPETLDSGNLTNIGSHMGMQSESIEPPPDPSDPDPYYLYQCCICNNFSTDSVESLGAHLALDRTTTVEGEILGNISGHFICKLCSYKTNLKANFQLHCKTDKHLQRLQHVNHVKEGGSKNEWKLKYLASPSSAAQIRCHACDYYTNSIHKLALHSASPRHEAASLLFRHLCESSLNISSYSKLYHCSLCGFSARNRLPLLQHVRSYRHIQMEQLHQLQKSSGSRGNENLHTDIAEIFQVSPDPNKIVELEPSSQMQAASDCNPSTEQAENDSDSSSEMKNDLEHDSEGNESGIRISCSHCPSQSSSNEDLRSTTQSAYGRQHIDDLNESEQESDRDILCPLCQECFKQRSALEKHVMQIHSVNSDGLQRLLLLVNQSHWLNTSSKHVATSIPCPEPMVASPTGVLTNKDWKQLTIDDGDSTMTCKLCLKVYRSSEEFQKHSKELHPTVIPNLAVSEKHVYKYRCGQCSLAFKTLEKLQQHSQYHAIRDATKCSLCCRSFRSMQSLHRHLESSHGEPSMNDGLICKELKVDNSETPVQTLVRGEFCQEEPCMDGNLLDDSGKVEEDDNETHDSPPSHKEHQVAEDYMNSQSMAEDHYSDPNRKFRCHRCKVAFTKHPYLSGHNKSLSHRKGEKPQYPMEKYLDPNRPYKCDICKESFTQKNILLVHYNSVSHLHKLKRAMQEQGDNNVQMNITPITTSVNLVERRNDQDKKPFKCHLCQVAYTQSSTLEIHKKSVLHQSRACRVHEPAISNHSDSTHSVADLPVLGPNASSTNTSPDGGSQISSWSEFFTPVSNQAEILRNYQSQCASNETYALFHQLETMNNSIKSEIKKQPVTVSSSGLHEKCFQYVGSQSTSTPMELQYDSSHKTSQMYTHLLESFGFDLVMQFNETHREKVSNQGGKAVSANAQQQGEREPLNEENELDNQNKPQSDEESFYMNHIDAESVPEMEKSTCQHCQQDFSSVWVLKAHCEEVHKDLVPHEFLEKYAQQFKNEYDKRIVIVTAATSSSTATMPITTSPLIFYAQDANSHDDLRGSEDGGRNQMIRVPEATSTTPNLNPSVLEERSNDDSVIPTTSVDGRRSMIPQHEHSQLTIAQHMSEMHAVFNALAATQLQQLQQYPSLMMSMMSLPLGINIPALAAMNLQPPLIPLMLPSTTFEATSGSFDDSATSSELLAQQNLTLQQQQLVSHCIL